MKKLLFALLCAAPLCAQTTTTYTGTVKDLTGATVTSGRITWTLNAPSGGSIPGTGSFVASTVSCLINSSGSPVSSVDGTSPCVITNNTSLTPTGTSYTLCIQPNFVTPGSCYTTFATGGTVNISTLVPTPATQPSYGVASTQINNTWAGAQTFTTATFSGGVTANLTGNVTGNVTGNITGAVTATTLNGTVLADQQSGADMCAKIITAAGTGALLIDASHFTGTQACASNAFASLSANSTLILGSVHVQATVPQTLKANGVTIKTAGPFATQWEYTGTSTPFIIGTDSSITQLASIWNITIEPMFVYGGTSNATDGLYAKYVHHSKFDSIYTWGVTGCGIHTYFAVTDTLIRPRTSTNDASVLGIISGHSQPTSGLCLDGPDSSHQTTNGTLVDPAAEGVSGTGWVMSQALSMNFVGGTSEQNGVGASISATSQQINFIGSYFEANTGQDIVDNGFSTNLTNVQAVSNSTSVTDNETKMVVLGGNINGFTGTNTPSGVNGNTIQGNNGIFTSSGNNSSTLSLQNGVGTTLATLMNNSGGSFNALPQSGDMFLAFGTQGANDTGGLVIGPRSSSSKGCRFNGVNGGMQCTAIKLSDQSSCTMASGACSAQSLSHTYTAAPVCFATWTGGGTLTGILKAPSTTTTVTPASSVGTDTAVVNWVCFGN